MFDVIAGHCQRDLEIYIDKLSQLPVIYSVLKFLEGSSVFRKATKSTECLACNHFQPIHLSIHAKSIEKTR